MTSHARYYSIFSFLLVLLLCTISTLATANNGTSRYNLHLSFDPEKQLLIGTAQIHIDKDKSLSLALYNLTITGTLLRDDSGREQELTALGDILILPATKSRRTLYLSYNRTVTGERYNLIDTKGISLTSNWYPTPATPMTFSVTAELPEGFTAIVESDTFPLKKDGNKVISHFSSPTTALHFIAGPYQVNQLKVREELYVYTMFFKEDSEQSSKYLKAAAGYLNDYEQELGPYPFNHYVIVANRQATGFGLPTFTLLGQRVLLLPFIIATSLGHEIVHSWFGNGVQVDYSQGNWCEGLTSYLSDHRFRERQGQGIENRKENILKYLSYVHEDTATGIKDFISSSHTQAMAESRRAVGYNRGALFFHELEKKIGKNSFSTALKHFSTTFVGRTGSWTDLKQVFETASDQDLSRFFEERLSRSDIPSITVENITVSSKDSHPTLNFSLIQETEKPYSLDVPVRITTISDTIDVVQKIDAKQTLVSIPLETRPLEFTIDPEYSFIRQLTPREMVPVWSQFLGAVKKLIVLEDDNARDIYQPLLDILQKDGVTVTTSDMIQNSDISANDVLFLGVDQRSLKEIAGNIEHPTDGVILDVRTNPLSEENIVAVFWASSRDEVKKVSWRLKHYGKYSFLSFLNGKKLFGRTLKADNGLHFVLESPPEGGRVKDTTNFHALIKEIAANRVIYVGENHTSYSDHLLQLRIIEALHKLGEEIAIGMEMFPSSSQPVLDSYILKKEISSEATFLKESGYFDVWRYDYRFFRDIINFAKRSSIPVIGLNLNRNTVSKVFRDGTIDTLTDDVRSILPPERDLTIKGYAESLRTMHAMHVSGNHATGSVSGFIQSQGLWDETMAENIASFLTMHPERKMVVLAGAQHTRKDFGIPPRVQRRIQVPQASVLNIYNDHRPTNLRQVADFFFLSSNSHLPDSPKLGIVVVPTEQNSKPALKIVQLSPHGKARQSGLQEDDILLQVAGTQISTMADLRIAMLDATIGDVMGVEVLRTAGAELHKLSFNVELTLPPKPFSHP